MMLESCKFSEFSQNNVYVFPDTDRLSFPLKSVCEYDGFSNRLVCGDFHVRTHSVLIHSHSVPAYRCSSEGDGSDWFPSQVVTEIERAAIPVLRRFGEIAIVNSFSKAIDEEKADVNVKFD